MENSTDAMEIGSKASKNAKLVSWSVGEGFHVPDYDDMKFQARYVRDLGDNRYYVSSFSAPNKEEE